MNVFWSILWLIILIFVSFFIASFCAGWYILFHPLTVCFQPLTPYTDLLLKGIQFPYYCAKAMVEGKAP